MDELAALMSLVPETILAGPQLLGCGWAPSGRIASASGEAGTDPVAPYLPRTVASGGP